MNNLRAVGDRERFGDLPGDADGAFERKTLAGELAQRPSFDELHRDVAIAADGAGFVNRDDIGVIEG